MSNIIIEKIIDIERRAQRIMEEAKGQKEGLDSYVENEEKRISREYGERAQQKVAHLQEEELQSAQQRMQELKQQTQAQKEQLRAVYDKNRDAWLEELKRRVIGQVAK